MLRFCGLPCCKQGTLHLSARTEIDAARTFTCEVFPCGRTFVNHG